MLYYSICKSSRVVLSSSFRLFGNIFVQQIQTCDKVGQQWTGLWDSGSRLVGYMWVTKVVSLRAIERTIKEGKGKKKRVEEDERDRHNEEEQPDIPLLVGRCCCAVLCWVGRGHPLMSHMARGLQCMNTSS